MLIPPVINCSDAESAGRKLGVLRMFLDDGALVHLDVSDGVFSEHATWSNPTAWRSLVLPFAFEAHLMAMHPEGKIGLWLAAGAKRIIVHVETLTLDSARKIAMACAAAGATAMLAINPETPIETFESYYAFFSEFQVLAVAPGPAGQAFDQSVIPKIFAIRDSAGEHATIEVDGGMNPQTAKTVKDAGADIVVAGTYIFESENPRKAFEMLKSA